MASQQNQEMQTLNMCSIDKDVLERLKKFRFRKDKTAAAIILKIKSTKVGDGKTHEVIIDEDMEDITTEELMEELPDSQPRYIIYSYIIHTNDNRTIFPLVCVYYHPRGISTEQLMLYAGSLKAVGNALGSERTFEMQEKEDLTDEFMHKKLGYPMPSC